MQVLSKEYELDFWWLGLVDFTAVSLPMAWIAERRLSRVVFVQNVDGQAIFHQGWLKESPLFALIVLSTVYICSQSSCMTKYQHTPTPTIPYAGIYHSFYINYFASPLHP